MSPGQDPAGAAELERRYRRLLRISALDVALSVRQIVTLGHAHPRRLRGRSIWCPISGVPPR